MYFLHTQTLQYSQLLNEQAQAGSGFSKNDFIATMLQLQARENEVRKSEQPPVSGAVGKFCGIRIVAYHVALFSSSDDMWIVEFCLQLSDIDTDLAYLLSADLSSRLFVLSQYYLFVPWLTCSHLLQHTAINSKAKELLVCLI